MVTIRRTLHFALLATLLLVGFTVPTQASTISAEHSASLLARLDTTNALFSYGGGKAGYLSPGRQVGHGWGGFDYGIQIDSLNGGRYGDVIVRSPDGILRIYHSDGTRLSGGYQIGHGWQSMSAIVAAEDWDKDGHPDIIASTSDGRLMLYPTRGAGNWGATRQIGQGWDGMDMLAVPGDLTGDGNPDLIAREKSTGYLYLYAGTGRGGFASRTLIGHGWKNFKNLTSFGDMDGDGIPDMIGQHENGRLYRYSGTGRGWWKPAVQIGHGWGDMSLPGQWKVTAQVGPPAPKPKPLRQPFVYGTLRTGDRGYHMVQGRTLSERKTTVPGYQLWVTHGGTWPWAVKASSSVPLVGQIMEFPKSTLATNIARLDLYEGYSPSGDTNTMRYHRVPATASSGEPVWIYETTPRQAQWVVRNGYRVTNGDWFRQVRAYSDLSSGQDLLESAPLPSQGESTPVSGAVTIDDAIVSNTCTSDLGTLTGGTFLELDITVDAPHGTQYGYVSAPAESFVAVNSLGLPFSPFDEDAKFCSATSDQLIAFVDDGITASGTLTLSGDIAKLFWINDAGLPELVWSKNGMPTQLAPAPASIEPAPTEPEPTEPALTEPEPAEPEPTPAISTGEPTVVPSPRP